MSYQPGSLGLAGGIAIVFVTSFSTFFLSAWSVYLDKSTTANWLVPLVVLIGGILALFFLLYALKYTSGDLFSACSQLLGKTAARVIAVYYIATFFLDAGLLLRQYSENTLLTALPMADFPITIGWYSLIVAIILFLGIEAISRASSLFLPVVTAGITLVLLLLLPQYEFLYLAPWNGPGLQIVALSGIKAWGFNLAVIIPFILATSFKKTRTIRSAVIYGLGISVLFRALAVAAFVATFGQGSGREKVLPFFEMARLVYINRFIQRIESLFILLWVILGVLGIAIEIYAGLYLLGRLFNLPALRPLIMPAVLIIAQLAMLPPEITGVLKFHVMLQSSYYNIGTVLIPFVLFLAALLKARGKASCSAVK